MTVRTSAPIFRKPFALFIFICACTFIPCLPPMLAKERKRKGLTQEEVAQQIGTSAPQVCRTEQKPKRTSVQTIMRYADAVGMELNMKLVARR